MGIKEKTVGEVRYFTYYLLFPKDKDWWVDQIPFVHDLQWELNQTVWKNDPDVCRDLLQKGETSFKDRNGVVHRIVIENVERPRRWGIRQPLSRR